MRKKRKERDINNPFHHLSKQQINSLLNRYYKGEKISVLIEEFHLGIKPTYFVSSLPEEILENTCPYCNTRLKRKRLNRRLSPDNTVSFCPSCGHKLEKYCFCDGCKNSSEHDKILFSSIKERIIDKNKSRTPVTLEELSIKEKILVGALLEWGLYEDESCISSLHEMEKIRFAPSFKESIEILNFLSIQERPIIVISELSDINSIEYDTKEMNYNLFDVRWKLNLISNHLNKEEIIRYLLMCEYDFDGEAFKDFWKDIATSELIEFSKQIAFDILKINLSIGKRTEIYFKQALELYPASIIHEIMRVSIVKISEWEKFYELNSFQQNAMILKNFRKLLSKSIKNNYNYTRRLKINYLTRPALTSFFLNEVLKIGFHGFHEIPTSSLEEINKIREKSISKTVY